MQHLEAVKRILDFKLAASFLMQDENGIIYGAEDILRDVQIAAKRVIGHTCLTIDARQARAALIGLLLSKTFGYDVNLSRDTSKESLPYEKSLELVTGVTAWLDQNPTNTNPGIRLSTSGTTGKAKTTFHTLTRLLAAVRNRQTNSKNVWLLTYEPASYAGIQVILTAAVNGAKLLAPKRSISSMAASVLQGCTHISATPSFWRALMAALPNNISLSLEAITLGGEPSTQDLLDALKSRFPNAAIRHIYASTEAGVGFTVNDGLAGFPSSWLNDGVSNVQLRIRDNELQIRTERGMLGYVCEATDPFKGGWLQTGDLVEIKDDRVFFQGRSDNLVNIGGAKVLPEKIEAILMGISDVIDIAVYGRPNPILGNLLIAEVCVVPGADLIAVEAALKIQANDKLPSFARPVRYSFVQTLDLSNGKKPRKYVFY